jgi:phospholipid/cholesterol/gamma-HCH transport system substrate-binding protein
MNSESKVGFFVFLGLVLLFLLATQVGSFKNLSKEGYHIHADMDDVSGLDVNSKIKANGIDIGYIENLKIQGDKVRTTMFIYEGMELPANSEIKPMQESMLGGKYLALTLGKDSKVLKDGDSIKTGVRLADFNDASNAMTESATEFKAFTKELREVLNGPSRENLRMTFANLEKITSELKNFTQLDSLNNTNENFNEMAIKLSETGDSFKKVADTINNKLPAILKNLDTLVSDLKSTSAEVRSKFPSLAGKFEKIELDLQALISENKEPVHNAINAADSFFSSGTETFDKVDDLLNTINKVQLEVAMRQEYMSSDESTKGYLSLDYIPSDSKRFQFEVAGMEDYTKSDESGNLIKPKKHEESKILVSAQIAKRYDDLILRAGVIESTTGAGVDYYLLNDKFKASAQIHDFNAEMDIRGNHPHAKVGARYTLLKHIDLYGGYDNFLNKESDNAYLGLGFRFFDDDLKTLIMSQSLGSMAK